MANETKEIKILIRADGSAAISGLKGVEGALGSLDQRTLSLTESFRKNWIAVTAGITGAYLALQKMWGWMEQAAKLEERMDTLNRLTQQYGMSADDLTGAIGRNSRGLIGMRDAAEVAVDALAKGFAPDQIARMASWAETAQETAAETMTVGQAFRSMEQAITAARERGVVKMFGATIDLEAALGKQAATTSKAEKAQALFTLVAKEAERRQRELGGTVDSAADRMERFTNSINQAKYFMGQLLLLVGQPFMAVFNVALTMAYGLAGAIGTVAATLALLTDGLGITKDKAADLNRWADKMYSNAAKQGEQAVQNMKGALDQLRNLGALGVGGGLPGTRSDIDDNRKRLEQLNDLFRRYNDERSIIQTAELDREIANIEKWKNEQLEKLDELRAGERERAAFNALYKAKLADAEGKRASKISDFYIAEQKRLNDERIKAEQTRIDEQLARDEQAVRLRMDRERAIGEAMGAEQSTLIRARAAGEREILELRQSALVSSITENTTFEKTLEIMREWRSLELEIEAIKTREVTDLDARRVELEREITGLKTQQRDVAAEIRIGYAQDALNKIGAGTAGAAVGIFAQVEAGVDPYRQDFDRWSAIQDEKIMRMIELGATEAQLRDEYRQYDLMQEQMVQQQKLTMASATFRMLGGMAQSFYALSGNQNKAAFKAMQMFRIAETTIDTYKAAVAAYSALAGIPIVGPALGAAAAAAAIAFGMAQVKAIAAMRPGGAGGVSAAAPAGVGGGGSVPSFPSPRGTEAQEPAEAPAPRVINIHVYGNIVDHDQFARELAPALEKAWDDGVG